MKLGHFMGLIALSSALAITGCGGGGGDSKFAEEGADTGDTATDDGTTAQCTNQSFSGTGPEVLDDFSGFSGTTTFTLSHDGTANFIVNLNEQPGGDLVTQLANEIGAVQDREQSESLDADTTYFIEVEEADGNWSIAVENPACSASGDDSSNTPSAGAPAAIEFVSADPETITLEGVGQSGLDQTSTVVFRVVDNMGNPVPDVAVDVRPSTEAGGLKVCTATDTCTNPEVSGDHDTVTGTTADDGTLTTSVVTGSVQSTVWVEALVQNDPTISTQSINLVATTGVPDQDSFSVSVETLNPEGYDYDGTTTEVTARLADRYNNPVPDGTQVLFTTEGGSIQGSCVTTDGACSATWTSQNPQPGDGRSTLLAYALGEESYTDNNGNGRFDSADSFDTNDYFTSPASSAQDVPEAFRDDNESGAYEQGEHFQDHNNSNDWTAGDDKFNGWLCDDSSRCSDDKSVHVFSNHLIVMAESYAQISSSASSITLDSSTDNPDQESFTITVVGQQTGQVMPADTTVSAETDHGSIVGESSYTVPNTNLNPQTTGTGNGNRVYEFGFQIEGEEEAGSGTITIKVVTPLGYETVYTIPVTENFTP